MFRVCILGDFYVYQCKLREAFIVNLKETVQVLFVSLSVNFSLSLSILIRRVFILLTGPKGGGQD